MPAYYRATLLDFLYAPESELVGVLSVAHATKFASQLSDATKAWRDDLPRLKLALSALLEQHPQAAMWSVLLEFEIPRKHKRIDVVLLTEDAILLLEQKTGLPSKEDCSQVAEYALLLHYFHEPSKNRRIVPTVVSPYATGDRRSEQQELSFRDTAAYWIAPVVRVAWPELASHLAVHIAPLCELPFDHALWDLGEYFPVPSIIEAARSLQAGLSIPSIAHSRAARHDITNLTDFITERVAEARSEGKHILCFVTGVPGSGKTLVGLNLAFTSRGDGDTLHFMSGNGPLVMVLQALFADYRHKVERYSAADARIHARTLIEDVHLFAKTYTELTSEAIPSNHVVIFDEAQRAWDYEQSYRKFGRTHSEPEMFLRIMERHPDWAVIIALVGGGQEINDGEAGLAEWGQALGRSGKNWLIYASPAVVHGGDSVAGSSLVPLDEESPLNVIEEPRLHLNVSVRSLTAENYSRWVNAVMTGNSAEAAALKQDDAFPVYLTRSLEVARGALRQLTIGHSRCGLVGSSKAERLRADGLEPSSSFHSEYPWNKWYLAPDSDVRSSTQLEVYATEFEIQGLELDWIGLCWGGDLIWQPSEQRWLARKFRNAADSGWSAIRKVTSQKYRVNSYRVLLTRARQGIILYVPTGDASDPTRNPREFDATADFLIACGVKKMEQGSETGPAEDIERSQLF